MNLKDMIEKLEEIQATDINEADPISGDMNKMVQDIDDAKARDQVPSSQLTKVTKDLTGKSAQTVDQQIDRLRNSQVPAIRDIIKKADMFDDLLNGPLKSQIAGVRPTVYDRRPVMGEHPNHKGIFIFNGLGTKGYLMAPLLSEEMADFIISRKELHREVKLSRFYKNP